MYRQEEPRSASFAVQAVSESISPENGAVGGVERPVPPQDDVPGAVVYLSDRGPRVVVVVLDVVVVVGAVLLVVVVGAVLLVVVVAAPLLVVVVAAPLLVVVVAAPLLVVVVAAPLLVVVVAAPVLVVVVAAPVVVVVAAAVVVVVLPGAPHVPPGPHASQQLGTDPTHAVPPRGGLQADSLLLIEQLVLPSLSVRQQVTKPGLPQVDCASQLITAPEHGGRSDPFSTASSVTISTQST